MHLRAENNYETSKHAGSYTVKKTLKRSVSEFSFTNVTKSNYLKINIVIHCSFNKCQER